MYSNTVLRNLGRDVVDRLRLRPVTFRDELHTCCFCFARTTAGVLFQAAPELVPCRGHHTNEKDTS